MRLADGAHHGRELAIVDPLELSAPPPDRLDPLRPQMLQLLDHQLGSISRGVRPRERCRVSGLEIELGVERRWDSLSEHPVGLPGSLCDLEDGSLAERVEWEALQSASDAGLGIEHLNAEQPPT